jgi:drug/metabolite transporter (DMT)-like permease
MITLTNYEKRKEKWNKQRLRGKTKFVLFYVIVYILFFAILSTLQVLFFHRSAFSDIKEFIFSYVIFLLFFVFAGIVVGNIAWKANLKRFKN